MVDPVKFNEQSIHYLREIKIMTELQHQRLGMRLLSELEALDNRCNEKKINHILSYQIKQINMKNQGNNVLTNVYTTKQINKVVLGKAKIALLSCNSFKSLHKLSIAEIPM